MAAQPNLQGVLRVVYVLVGIALMAWGFFGAEGGWLRIVTPIVGAVALTEGLIGY